MSRPLRLAQQTAPSSAFSCLLCKGANAEYVFGANQFKIYRCTECTLTYNASRAEGASPASSVAPHRPARDENGHANLVAALEAMPVAGPVLVIAGADNGIVALLERRGIQIGRVVAPEAVGAADWGGPFSAAIICDEFMRVDDPRATLETLRRHLPVDAPLLLTLPLLDRHQARSMGRNWHEWQPSNLWYFTRETLSLLLLSTGFEHIWFRHEPRRYAPSGSDVVTCSAAPDRHECVVSIVVPVFNEARTLQAMMTALLAKELPGMRKEIIMVESNSTDGSRDLVRSYENHPDVRVLLQPAPRGKGNAVREGIGAATGEILMIQDADLEYDLDDYDELLAPLVRWRSMFVLGSRHRGGWKMRKFADSPMTAAMFNLGHVFFRTLINLAVNTRMADPFTMFKVVRRDALYGLEFTCDRFDFDIELVIKLVRKGYSPLELPVNYASRSFAEGKKVSVTRDGITWIKTILQARFSRLGSGRE